MENILFPINAQKKVKFSNQNVLYHDARNFFSLKTRKHLLSVTFVKKTIEGERE